MYHLKKICLRVRDRVTLRNSDISVDYPSIFFSDEQRQIQVIEEFMESIQNSPKIAKRNTNKNLIRQSSKEFSNLRNRSIRKTRIEIFEEKMARESSTLECMGDDFILKALTTEPRQIK